MICIGKTILLDLKKISMSQIKNANTRYKILDECFRSTHRNYTMEDLIETCNQKLEDFGVEAGVKKRTIQYDIDFMKSDKGWEIELDETLKDGKKTIYRYADTSFSINNSPLKPDEVIQLKSMLGMLKRIKGLPLNDWMFELIPKLTNIDASEKDNFMSFSQNTDLVGFEYLRELYFAIYNKKVLNVSYQPYENPEPYIVEFHPYFLKQYNERWFVFGYDPSSKKFNYNLAFDRIKNIAITNIVYIENTEIDFNDYFDDMIGVTKPKDAVCEDIVLQIIGNTANYVETKPWHSTQKNRRIDAQTLEIRLNVMVNKELIKLILAHGSQIKVVHPQLLIDIIKGEIEEMGKVY